MFIMQVFSTEKAARLLGLEPWRVIKFAQSKEYGITPSLGDAAGSGSRRLYSLEDICQIGLAVRLLETGLRSKVVGKVLRQVRETGKLSTRLHESEASLSLAIYRIPEIGKPLDEKRRQRVAFITNKVEALKGATAQEDFILVPLGSLFTRMNEKLSELQGGE
jgi:DNA-binding transcriptional MerR regulator